MNTLYYLIEASYYPNYENSLDQLPVWKLDKSQCLIEVPFDFEVYPYINSWDNSNEFQDYIHNPIRVDEWVEIDISEIP
jgi:hypothetical protein